MKTLLILIIALAVFACDKEDEDFNFQSVSVSTIKVDTDKAFTDISFGSGQVGYACGEMGILFKTGDGGATWSSLKSGITPSLHCIDAFSDNQIFTARNELYRSGDGGANWTTAGLDDQGSGIFDIRFLSSQTGFIAKNGIMKTTDGGTTWTLVFDSSKDENYYAIVYNAIEFVNNNIGFCAGGKTHDGGSVGTIVKTKDGGNNWENLNMDMSQITAFHFMDENNGFVFNFDKEMWKTTDGGKNWTLVSSDIPDRYVNCYFIDSNKIVLKTPESIYHSLDGGKNWIKDYAVPEGGYLTAMEFINSKLGFACGHNGLIAKIEIK
ncbi:MAG: hypothetical protein A2W90_08270 [Bacteroidetes bacterium GWF2_42_66]|nr:MAG: hypothetical protein A2W92_21095 [Bacteroidetes bacterium GWA2_42_15]OFX96468.1 MAG: hypothetical protein A2W89_05930 [Bacteroidetes bacterium GWE2_42_39]OFY40888.1 MAG: hypothetical protein A2W90_08270 [Bacteroidetes bacterium GWF2_42_66]HBL76319.1 hypothetical protein [Prolixibacteraceae bacterium]HCR92127.1 hypothetical protein [Prolixibacteraceae bacterium]